MTAKRRRRIIAESENEGKHGISGRDSTQIFGEFYTIFGKVDSMIDMSILWKFFQSRKELRASIPEGFLESLQHMYDYSVLQEVKESLYYYNEDQIGKEIKNYMFAVNFELGSTETCPYTKDKIEITEDYLAPFEGRILGSGTQKEERHRFRKGVQKEYTTQSLTQEMLGSNKRIDETDLFSNLKERYIYNQFCPVSKRQRLTVC